MDARILAGEQRVLFVELGPAARLRGAVLGDPAPGEGRVLVFPFGHRDDFAVVPDVRLEGQEARLTARHLFHHSGLGGVGRGVDIGALAVTEDYQEHSRTLSKKRSGLSLSKSRPSFERRAR